MRHLFTKSRKASEWFSGSFGEAAVGIEYKIYKVRIMK